MFHEITNCYNIFLSSKINESALNILGSEIRDNLSQLQGLSINFEACKNITNNAVQMFVSELGKYLTQLQFLELEFYNCERLTDRALEALALEIGQLSNLRKLYLNFNGCNLTDQGIKSLGLEVGRLTRLEQLNLQLVGSGFGMITGQSVENMGKELGKLDQLQRLWLNLGRCPQITIDKVEALLLNNLKNLTELKKLELYFNSVTGLSQKKRKEFMLRCIPSLNL